MLIFQVRFPLQFVFGRTFARTFRFPDRVLSGQAFIFTPLPVIFLGYGVVCGDAEYAGVISVGYICVAMSLFHCFRSGSHPKVFLSLADRGQ
jgi:hypothetical protein